MRQVLNTTQHITRLLIYANDGDLLAEKYYITNINAHTVQDMKSES
jgi:hypothetical protein